MSEYTKYMDRSSVWGYIYWKKTLGSPMSAAIEDCFKVWLVDGDLDLTHGEDWPISRSFVTYDISNETEYVVAYWGAHIVHPLPVFQYIEILITDEEWSFGSASLSNVRPNVRVVPIPQHPTIIRLGSHEFFLHDSPVNEVVLDVYERNFFEKLRLHNAKREA